MTAKVDAEAAATAAVAAATGLPDGAGALLQGFLSEGEGAAAAAADSTAAAAAAPAAAAVVEDENDEFSIANLVSKASELKEQGNALFKAKDYYGAKAKYTKIPLYLNHLDLTEVPETAGMAGMSSAAKPSDEQMTRIRELRNVCYQNSAICCYQLKEYARGLDFAERAVLCNKEKNQKSVLIRAKLRLVTGDVDGAEADLNASAAFYSGKPEAKDVDAELRKLELKRKEQRDKERRLFSGWLSSPTATATATADTAAAAEAPKPTTAAAAAPAAPGGPNA